MFFVFIFHIDIFIAISCSIAVTGNKWKKYVVKGGDGAGNLKFENKRKW